MLRRRFIAPILITLCLLIVALPVAQANQTPEEAAELYLQYMRDRRWLLAAEMIVPDQLDLFKQFMVDVLTLAPEEDPDEDEFLAMVLGPGSTRQDLLNSDPASLLAGILRMAMTLSGMSLIDGQVLGAVYETPELAHVVIRSTVVVYGQYPVSTVDVITTVQTPHGWLLGGQAQMESLIQLVQSLYAEM